MDVDVVVVAYRSAAHLRGCVEPLCREAGIRVIVADNACPEGSPATIADLPAEIVDMGGNRGFSVACNAAAARGHGEAILFLNPDARTTADDVRLLAATLAGDPERGACGPLILDGPGLTCRSVRRDPRLRSTFSEALFLHHLRPAAPWATEIVQDGYGAAHAVEWLSGAALCVRRSAFETVGGFDESFFLYSEDADLCARLRAAGLAVVFEPGAVARHEGGASAPSSGQAALKAAARIRYARIHARGARYLTFRLGFVLHELLRLPPALLRSPAHLRGRVASLAVALGRAPRTPPRPPAPVLERAT